MSELELFVFGSPHLERQGKLIPLNLRKAMALLVYLAVSQETYTRDTLATLFWPENDQSSARASLRRTIYIVNKAAGVEILESSLDSVSISKNLDIWIDVEVFRGKTGGYLMEESPSLPSDPDRIAELEQSVALYRDDFLAGFTLPDCPQFDEWQFFESESLRDSLGEVLEQLVLKFDELCEFERAIQYARKWLALDRVHEPAHRWLMELYAKSGQQAAALRQYQECARILEQELELLPESETTKLYERIRRQRGTKLRPIDQTRPEVKYVRSGDVYIAYQVLGEGPVDLVFVCGYISHLHQFWEEPDMASFYNELAKFSRLILFDRRGGGLSDRVGYPPTLEDTMDDILAVMGAAGSTHAVLFGVIDGGPASVLFAATYPERISGLILFATNAKFTRSEDYPWAITQGQYDRWLEHIVENWGGPVNIENFAPSRANDRLLREWWAKSLQMASSPGGMKAVLEVMRDIDVRDILPVIRTPTLILHRKDDKSMRVGAGRYLAGKIPGAKYVELEGADTWWFVGDSQPILREMKTFVQDLKSPIVPERLLATILLIEILDREKSIHLCDPKIINVDPTYIHLHKEMNRFRGNEVGWKEGRYVATFDGPSRAIHCVKAILQFCSLSDSLIRAGLHTGECEFADGELTGGAMVIAEYVLSKASENEVLVSGTVKDLVVGAGFGFEDRGQHSIEGVSGRWRVYCLR